ncbi:MAG TPA: hypothetical protein VE779_01370 [Candidatus Angelobacter sp.]|nr:hypothetical protein [Candidatus Angelobacter sp.]
MFTEKLMTIGNAEVAVGVGREASAPTQIKTFLSRYFYFCMSLVLAGLVVWGFSKTVDANLFHAKPARPGLLWMHGAVFCTWVVFFIAQSALVRVRKVSVHRALGWFGAGLATVMVGLGFTIAVVMARFDTAVLHQTGADAFLSIPIYDMIAFGTLIGLAIFWRKKPDYHRRLVFIASCGLMDAALGRFDFLFNHNLFYPALDALMVLGAARDLVVDGRVHKVYRYALPVLIVGQSLAMYAWRANPAWWQTITRAIMG